jgi:hypothetical protein
MTTFAGVLEQLKLESMNQYARGSSAIDAALAALGSSANGKRTISAVQPQEDGGRAETAMGEGEEQVEGRLRPGHRSR